MGLDSTNLCLQESNVPSRKYHFESQYFVKDKNTYSFPYSECGTLCEQANMESANIGI